MFDFTEYLERQKEEDGIDLGLFFDLAEDDIKVHNQTPVLTLIEDMEKLKNGFPTNGVFILGDEKEKETNRSYRNGSELAKFLDKILDNCDYHPSIYYTGIIYRFFKSFKQVNRSEHERGTNKNNKILEYEGENCFVPSGNGCFLKCIICFFKNYFTEN